METITGIIISKSKDFITILSPAGSMVIQAWQALLMAGISVAIGLTMFILLGIGLFTMAKKREIGKKWLAFVPFARYLLMGKLIGEVRFFGKKTAKLGLITCLILLGANLVTLIITLLSYCSVVELFLREGGVNITMIEEGMVIEGIKGGVSYPRKWVYILTNVLDMISLFTDIASLIALVTIYVELFKRYAPDHYLLYAILSIIVGIEGIMVFIVRNKPAVNYGEYMKEKFIKMQGGFMNMQRNAPEDPFKEYARKGEYDPGDPFGEFSQSKPTDSDVEDKDDETK